MYEIIKLLFLSLYLNVIHAVVMYSIYSHLSINLTTIHFMFFLTFLYIEFIILLHFKVFFAKTFVLERIFENYILTFHISPLHITALENTHLIADLFLLISMQVNILDSSFSFKHIVTANRSQGVGR